VLLTRTGLTAAQARIAGIIQSSSRRMERIVRDLLDYSRMRAKGGIPLSVRTTDVGEICERVVEEVQLSARDGAVELSCDGDLSGEWDPDRLQQAIGNLVANAVQHGPPGALARVRATGEPGLVRVEVENDGPAIPPEVVPSLFDPFHRGAASAGTLDGVGLGLFIVKSIVDAHGGAVDAGSRTPGSVTFTIRLPRTRPGARRRPTSGIWRPARDAARA
jgi:signal transduction histidine kinase